MISKLDRRILVAIRECGDNAYGVPIRDALEKSGRYVSIGEMYERLNWLESNNLITSCEGEATPERGYRPKRYYKVEFKGLQELEKTWLVVARNRVRRLKEVFSS